MKNPAARRGSVWWGVAFFLVLLPTLFYPPHRDAATFWLEGRAIARGEMPYVAIWDLKPPGIYLLYALPAALNSNPLESWIWVRVFDCFLLVASAVLVTRIARRLGILKRPELAALWLIALYLAGNLGSLAQAEAWANPFWLLGWWLLLRSEGEGEGKTLSPRQMRGMFGSGAATALAFSCKPTSAAPMLAILAWTLALQIRNAPRNAPRNALQSALIWWLGFAFVGGALVLWLQRGGAWEAFLDIQRGFVVPYIGSARDPAPAHALVLLFLVAFYVARFPIPAILALLGLLSRLPPPRARRVIGIALAGSIAALWVQNRVFEYHLQILLPLAALVIATGSEELARLMRLTPRASVAVWSAAPLLWLLLWRWPAVASAPFYAGGYLSRQNWLHQIERRSEHRPHLQGVESAGHWLQARARTGDRLLVWGFAPEVHLFSQIPPAQRFAFLPPIGASYAPARWKTEFLNAIQSQPPRFIAVTLDEDLRWVSVKAVTPWRALREWNELSDWFTPRYRRAASWKTIEIWERR